jgi:hypothetical protein
VQPFTAWLIERYLAGVSVSELADETGIRPDHIRKRLKFAALVSCGVSDVAECSIEEPAQSSAFKLIWKRIWSN